MPPGLEALTLRRPRSATGVSVSGSSVGLSGSMFSDALAASSSAAAVPSASAVAVGAGVGMTLEEKTRFADSSMRQMYLQTLEGQAADRKFQEQSKQLLDHWATKRARFEEEVAFKLELSLLRKFCKQQIHTQNGSWHLNAFPLFCVCVCESRHLYVMCCCACDCVCPVCVGV